MWRRALVIIGIPLVFLLVLLWFFFFYTPQNPSENPPSSESSSTLPVVGTTSTPQGATMSVQGKTGVVITKNFYSQAQQITPQNDALIAANDSFRILYYAADNSFVITLLKEPVGDAQQAAEMAFLSQLGISQSDACKLKVSVSVPAFVDENLAGQDLGLTFCK